MVMHVAKHDCSGSWGSCGVKDTLMWERRRVGGLRAPFLEIALLWHSAAPWAQELPSTSHCMHGLQHPLHFVPGVPSMRWWQQCCRRVWGSH